jgi:lipoprotein-anchoring transpeptidase ErfK/SrfK
MKFSKTKIFHFIIAILILLPYIGLIITYTWFNQKAKKIQNAHFIVVSKENMRLSLYNYKGKEVYNFPIACGLNYGDKTQNGDKKTPEGIFHIVEIQQSESWSHDFGDGLGEVEGAYGPFFMRLDVPNFNGIGIHGTHNPESLNKRVTEGCIRLKNQDLLKIVPLINPGSVVIITTSADDILKSDSVKSIPMIPKSVIKSKKNSSKIY